MVAAELPRRALAVGVHAAHWGTLHALVEAAYGWAGRVDGRTRSAGWTLPGLGHHVRVGQVAEPVGESHQVSRADWGVRNGRVLGEPAADVLGTREPQPAITPSAIDAAYSFATSIAQSSAGLSRPRSARCIQ